jgi:hypothetical protein
LGVAKCLKDGKQGENCFLSNAPDIWQHISLFADSQVSSDFVSDKSSIKVKITMEQCWNDTDKYKIEVLEENPVTVILRLLKFSHSLRWERRRTSCVMGR